MSSAWWQEQAPLLATRYDHLLHSLFAFASLHIASLRPAEAGTYVAISAQYRDRALQTLAHQFARSQRMEAERADVWFWSSSIIGMIHLAEYHQKAIAERPAPTALLLKLTDLWRGANNIAKLTERLGDMRSHPNVRPMVARAEDQATESTDRQLKDVTSRTKTILRFSDIFDADFKRTCITALDNLLKAVQCRLQGPDDFGGILSWFVCLDSDIREEVADVEEESVNVKATRLLLVLYGAALSLLRDLWYVKDFGQKLVEELTPVTPLADRETVKIVNWAREQVCP